jgi:hypothetical protein
LGRTWSHLHFGKQITARKKDDHVEVLKTEARQGETGHKVRYFLGFGLGLTTIAFIIIGIVYFA